MDLQEYRIKAFRTMKFLPVRGTSDHQVYKDYRDDAKDPKKAEEYHLKYLEWGRTHPTHQDLSHMLIGMCSELNELKTAIINCDEVNIGEELGDIMWYVSGWSMYRNINISAQMDLSFYQYDNLVNEISILHNIAKRHIAYGKDMDVEAEKKCVQKLVEICYNFEWKFNVNKIYLPDCLTGNIRKLAKRYPVYFSDFLAWDENRNLEVERKALESDGL